MRVGFLTGLIIFQNKNSFNKVHKVWEFYGQIALFCMQKNERKAFIDSSHLKILCLANDRLTLTVFILGSSHVLCVFKAPRCLIYSSHYCFVGNLPDIFSRLLWEPQTSPWKPLVSGCISAPAGAPTTGRWRWFTDTDGSACRNRSLFCAVSLRRRRTRCLSSFVGRLT